MIDPTAKLSVSRQAIVLRISAFWAASSLTLPTSGTMISGCDPLTAAAASQIARTCISVTSG